MPINMTLVAVYFLTTCVKWHFLPKTEINVFLKIMDNGVLVGDHRIYAMLAIYAL